MLAPDLDMGRHLAWVDREHFQLDKVAMDASVVASMDKTEPEVEVVVESGSYKSGVDWVEFGNSAEGSGLCGSRSEVPAEDTDMVAIERLVSLCRNQAGGSHRAKKMYTNVWIMLCRSRCALLAWSRGPIRSGINWLGYLRAMGVSIWRVSGRGRSPGHFKSRKIADGDSEEAFEGLDGALLTLRRI